MLENPIESWEVQLQVFRQRIIQLETINVELEHRLEKQAKERMELEHEGAESEARWEMKRIELMKEADEWKHRYEQQQLQNLKLRDQLLRTERELHGVLQKKYDIMQAAKREERHRIREEQQLARDGPWFGESQTDQRQAAGAMGDMNPQGLEPQAIRRRHALDSLRDFFSI